MLSIQHFLCWLWCCPPSKVPCRIVLERLSWCHDIPELCMFLSLDRCWKRFQWAHREVDLALYLAGWDLSHHKFRLLSFRKASCENWAAQPKIYLITVISMSFVAGTSYLCCCVELMARSKSSHSRKPWISILFSTGVILCDIRLASWFDLTTWFTLTWPDLIWLDLMWPDFTCQIWSVLTCFYLTWPDLTCQIWSVLTWFDLTWFDLPDLICSDLVWSDQTWRGPTWPYWIWPVLIWPARPDLFWPDLIWPDLTFPDLTCQTLSILTWFNLTRPDLIGSDLTWFDLPDLTCSDLIWFDQTWPDQTDLACPHLQGWTQTQTRSDLNDPAYLFLLFSLLPWLTVTFRCVRGNVPVDRVSWCGRLENCCGIKGKVKFV